jgi:alpha-mannosidase
VAAGTAAPDTPWPPASAGDEGLAVDGDDVELSSLRRRDGEWLEARLVNLSPARQAVTVRGGLFQARRAGLRGEPQDALDVGDGELRIELGPAEIATIQLRRRETAAGRPEVLDAAGPRQSL